jgi:DNA-binding winged helix-turn-helix (wHTH) protein/TolB-like protein
MPGRHRFGPFEFNPEQRELYRNGTPVPLQPKLADLLAALLERRGQVIGKEELMKRVWPDTRVEETGLARNISLLRKALGDEGEQSLYIETVPKRGYRFLAAESPADPREVRRSARRLAIAGALLAAAGVGVWWQFYRSSAFVASPPGTARLAVIPFDCRGGWLCGAVFSQPFEELLAAELLRTGRARLVSPSTVRRYCNNRIPLPLMARLLGLDAVLEGSVVEMDGRVRIVARRSDAHSGRLIWSESFDVAAGDPAAAQRAAAARIASAVGKAL